MKIFTYSPWRLLTVVLAGFLTSLLGQSAVAQAVSPILQPGSRPNIVLIISDDQSYDSAKYMPAIEGPEWLDFTQYYVNTSLCCPSRTTMLTGQYSHHTGVEQNENAKHFRDGETLATWLHRADYRTGLFGKYLNEFPWQNSNSYVPPGWDDWSSFMGSPGYYDYDLSVNGRRQHRGSAKDDYSTDVFTRHTLDFIKRTERRDTQPFFAVYAPYGPHSPRIPAPRHQHQFRGDFPNLHPNVNERDVFEKPDWVKALGMTPLPALREKRREEINSLRAVNDAVRDIVTTLRQQNELDHTVIMYVSDNGYSFGSHRLVGKNCNYEECVRVPFRMRAPGVAGHQVSALTSNVDLAPTIVELAAADTPIKVDGRSLLPLLNGQPVWRDAVLLHTGPRDKKGSWGVVTDRYKYLENAHGATELYDLTRDPYEMVDQSKSSAYQGIRQDLARKLRELRQAPGV